MKLILLTTLLSLIFTTVAYCKNMKWFSATELGILGRDHIHDGYNRFTDDVFEKIKAEKMDSVYTLAHNCAGLHLDFSTNAKTIKLKFKVDDTPSIPNMPYSGSHAIDTYIKYNEKWMYFSTTYPTEEAEIFNKTNCINLKNKDFIDFSLNLPLYSGVTLIEIGIPEDAKITPIRYSDKKPILVYGTSITQGGCASRPGTCYTTILRRSLMDRDVYNLGFSGSGKLEHLMSNILSTYDPEIIIIDSSTNMADFSDEEFAARYDYFYKTFRAKHPITPIVLMEQPVFGFYWAVRNDNDVPKGNVLRVLYKKWKKQDKNVYIIHSKNLYGSDYEASVDQVHASDVGFARMSKEVIKLVNKILAK